MPTPSPMAFGAAIPEAILRDLGDQDLELRLVDLGSLLEQYEGAAESSVRARSRAAYEHSTLEVRAMVDQIKSEMARRAASIVHRSGNA